jgi:hypothetical protein
VQNNDSLLFFMAYMEPSLFFNIENILLDYPYFREGVGKNFGMSAAENERRRMLVVRGVQRAYWIGFSSI